MSGDEEAERGDGEVIVRDRFSGWRLNRFILDPEFREAAGSRSIGRAALREGLVRVNGEKGVEGARVLKAGDRVGIDGEPETAVGSVGLETRYKHSNVHVLWKPPGVTLDPTTWVDEAGNCVPRERGRLAPMFGARRAVGCFVVMLRPDTAERNAVVRSARSTIRALVDGRVEEELHVSNEDGQKFNVKPVRAQRTTKGFISTVDVVCHPCHLTAMRKALRSQRLTIIEPRNSQTRRSPAKGTYLAMVSLSFELADGGPALSFTTEEPAKFNSLRAREDKFRQSKDEQLRREDGMPLAYEQGSKVFDGMELLIERHTTMIPRISTEALVHATVELMQGALSFVKEPCVLDLGTGCGNILLAVLNRCRSARGVGLDLEPAAVRIAAENAKRSGLADRSEFVQLDFAELDAAPGLPTKLEPGFRGPFDVIISNPPYYSEKGANEMLDEYSLKYEPRQALITPGDNLYCYDAIARSLARCAKTGNPMLRVPHGRLVVEVASGTTPHVTRVIESNTGMRLEQVVKDTYKLDRCLVFKMRSPNSGAPDHDIEDGDIVAQRDGPDAT